MKTPLIREPDGSLRSDYTLIQIAKRRMNLFIYKGELFGIRARGMWKGGRGSTIRIEDNALYYEKGGE